MAVLPPSCRRLLRLLGVGLTTAVSGCGASQPETPTEASPETTTAAPHTTYREPATRPPRSRLPPPPPPGKLLPRDGDSDDNFGSAVAVTADRALVAARRDEHPDGTWSGSAYVLDRLA